MADVPDRPASPAPPDTVDLPAGAGAGGGPGEGRTPPAVGQSFGDYELLGEIERGGMGVVYHARERHSGRLVALKTMLDESASSPADLSRFVLEAQAAGELSHPGVVAIHAWGVHDGHPFYTMDFVAGRPLHRLLADGPLPVGRATRYLLGIAGALAAAHAAGIVHRDLKPSNVMIDSADQPRVLDFGLAKRHRPTLVVPAADEEVLDALPAGSPSSPARRTVPVAAPITERGAILGTPSYMAPEQVRAERHRVGPPADVHALGAIFYEMLTGRPPFVGESTYATLMQVLDQEPAGVRDLRPEVPAALAAVVGRCLAKDPHERYPDAAALADDLERVWRRITRRRRFARLALLAALAVVGLQALEPLLWGGPLLEHAGLRGLVRSWAPGPEPLREAAAVLDRLLRGLVVVGGPLSGGIGLVVWSWAWVWYAERPGRVWLGWAAAAAAALGGGWLAGLEVWPPGVVFLPWLLLANALVAGVAALARRDTGRPRADAPAVEGGSYLQKLFTVRGTARPKRAAGEGRAVGLADFELGKMLHAWDGGAVHWARQKSLDRAVLVWRDGRPSGSALPGVVVRHPAVLGLHAVSSSPEGRLLVTEPAAASPLAEVLQQRPPSPREAVALTARLAEAVQAFHDQGACHGRLGPEWVLVRGDLEPVLCPCGVPAQSPEDRAADVRALGRLLHDWLPPRPSAWRFEMAAPVYRVCDAAREGRYARAADLASDLERAARAGQVRWRERWASALVYTLLLLSWLALPLGGLQAYRAGGDLSPPGPGPLGYALLGLCPAALLLGYVQARSLVQRRRLRGGGRDLIFPGGVWRRLVQTALFVGPAAALGWVALAPNGAGAPVPAALPALLGILFGFWLSGAGLAGVVTFGELLAGSLRHDR
jgi:tRNA A-37 threonylcarbamoyl transferase component Bud32